MHTNISNVQIIVSFGKFFLINIVFYMVIFLSLQYDRYLFVEEQLQDSTLNI